MDKQTLDQMMQAERLRLDGVLNDIRARREALDQEEAAVKIEIYGISAYQDAKEGKLLMKLPGKMPKVKGTASGTRGPRQTGIKERVLEVVTAEGISKQDILNKLDAGDDKAMQQAVSNALVALKKDNKVKSGERGMYQLQTEEPPADTPPPTARRVKKEETPAT